MKTFRVPAQPIPLRQSVFLPVAVSGGPAGEGCAKALGWSGGGRVVQALLLDMSLSEMDDNGMWVWAGILALVSLAFSYGVAVLWRRWREGQKRRA